MKVSLIGCACDLGVAKDGAGLGPEKLKTLLKRPDLSFRIIAPQNPRPKSRDPLDLRKNEEDILEYDEILYREMVKDRRAGFFAITVGGDHIVGLPSALASQAIYGPIGVMWADAHTDFNTYRTTVTGNIHGLPLAAIAGYECEELRTWHKEPTVNPASICVVGARSIDPLEKINVADAGIHVISTAEFHALGTAEAMARAFDETLKNTNGVHLSFDLDLIDPNDAPGVSVPEVNGISGDEAVMIHRIIAANIDKVVAYDLVELNPLTDRNDKTAKLALKLLNIVIEAAQRKETKE